MTYKQKKCILAYQLMDSTVSQASRSWSVVHETNRNYPSLVAKIKIYMSNKTQNEIIFHDFENRGHIKYA